ncbi:hypothetical protein FOCC_FOCC016539 [Frankliniella occidentalis]|nr:hypothetical protein FOCC_FOCC016539 [Frankliniella occidentalis]
MLLLLSHVYRDPLQRPSLLQASRLVVEFSKVEGCDEPGNAIRYYNVATRMVSKTDFSLSGNFNVTRSVPSIDSGTYSLQNITISTSLLESVPLPWEGNVWLVRFGMLDTKTRFHICTDSEMHVHRVRDN